MSSDLTVTTGSICSICQSPVRPEDATRVCDGCRAVFHDECYAHNAGCGTYGCERAPEALKVYVTGEQPEAGVWGDAKYCPACNDLIESRALKCPSCKARFETRAPMTPEEYQAQLERKRQLKKGVWIAVVLFAASAFGILAPVTLVISLVLIFSRRNPGRRAAGVAELLTFASAAVSLSYVVLMVAIFGFGW